jgi:outer membrane receptor protein involved in Fe transport
MPKRRALLLSLTLIASIAFAFSPSEATAQAATGTSAAETPSEADKIAAEIEAESEDDESWTSAREGIEERVILAGESAATADFSSGDSVAGFDASDIEALGAVSVADIGQFTPNLEVRTTGATTPTFFIRGVGLNDFNANSASAVAIYFDDIVLNASALQLSTLFDMEAVNVMRGPQGSGLARNASAGAIKMYSRRPSGDFGGYLRLTGGNYSYQDYEGAIEAPVYKDIIAARVAFRLSKRNGYQRNRCGNQPDIPAPEGQRTRFDFDTGPWSKCTDSVPFEGQILGPSDDRYRADGFSLIPEDLPEFMNDRNTWAARATISFQPTLDQTWYLGVRGSQRDELGRGGVSYGTNGAQIDEFGNRVVNTLGGKDGEGYQRPEVAAMQQAVIDRVWPQRIIDNCAGTPGPACPRDEFTISQEIARGVVAPILANDLDTDPRTGDYNNPGVTQLNSWGVSLRNEISLPYGMEFKGSLGYDGYDRYLDTDLDSTPNTLFHTQTDDDGYQIALGVQLTGDIVDVAPIRWDIGGFYLYEQLGVSITNQIGLFGAGLLERLYTQTLSSYGVYLSLEYDFWENFTLEGGVRYNSDTKEIDFSLVVDANEAHPADGAETWSAPTGFIRLDWRFRENTYAYWKYTRGWKGGHFNATANRTNPITAAAPETNDAFEVGLAGSWFDGRVRAQASFFYYSYSDYQLFLIVQDFNSNPEFQVLNASDVEVYGSEADVTYRPWTGAFMVARFGWLESQFKDFVQNQLVETGSFGSSDLVEKNIDRSGNRLLNSPRFTLTLTGEQTIPLGRFGELTTRYDGNFTDTLFFNSTEGRGDPNVNGDLFLPENTLGQRGFWIHNLTAIYRPPGTTRVEIVAWGRNLTDEVYKSFAFNVPLPFRTTVDFLADPRTFGVTVDLSF